MPKQNAYLARRDRMEQAIWETAQATYMQYMADLITLTLNDPDFMGRDTFSVKRLKRVRDGIKHYDALYTDALSTKPEADYLRAKMDENMKRILRDDPEYVPFQERYPYVKEICYGKKKK